MPSTPSERQCSNCGRPMRVLDLSGHYQRPVQVDTCAHCCLAWFDGTESVRLAGPGIAELVREIHGAMQADGEHAHAVSLARVQTCPVCEAALKSAANQTRFGRTTHLECPNGHGYYQTYILYLAEKGFVRPLAWSDIRSMLAQGKEMFCASCGCPLPARPLEACPACQSAIGIIDPTRLASAIMRDDAIAPATAPTMQQHKCQACGGALDVTRDIHCPHCHAPVLRSDTGTAAGAAAEALAARAVNRPAPATPHHAMANAAQERRAQRLRTFEYRLAFGVAGAAILAGVFAWYRQPSERQDWTPQEAALTSYDAHFRPPIMECDPDSPVRREARVRQLIVVPGVPGPGPLNATFGAVRAAHIRAVALRKHWESSGAYELLAEQENNPYATARSMPEGMFRRGEVMRVVELAAFCLPVNVISPPLLAEDGFHVIQVVEAR
ncbi:MAG: hypothetical protein K0R43_541 [Pseudoduganella sp.]|nr:hypothetical protein [Pseudoduganella sp.]